MTKEDQIRRISVDDDAQLTNFVTAQAPIYDQVRAELKRCAKQSHWIWYIFPQLCGLGRSPMARHYVICTLNQARAYLAHPILGARLHECTQLMLNCAENPLAQILPPPDDWKFRSSMTLFARAAAEDATASEWTLFQRALTIHCDGQEDPQTLALLGLDGNIPS